LTSGAGFLHNDCLYQREYPDMAKSSAHKTPSAAASEARLPTRSEPQRDVINRLRRIEGQVRAVTQMVEQGRGCEDIAQQMAATRRAMDKAFYRMMACSMLDSMAGGASPESLEKSTRILERYA
jgi:DNA-binding FrmR family transcriptional regulator